MSWRKIIALDMDGVLCDIERHYITWYKAKYCVEISYDSLLGKAEGEAFPEKNAIRDFILTPGFFRSIPVMPGAVEVVSALMKDHAIYVASAAMEFPLSLSEKYEWLREHFPFISWRNIVFCGDKSIINADYLVDDHCKNLDHFTGTPILFNAAHNANVTHHRRVMNWWELLIVIKRAENDRSRAN